MPVNRQEHQEHKPLELPDAVFRAWDAELAAHREEIGGRPWPTWLREAPALPRKPPL